MSEPVGDHETVCVVQARMSSSRLPGKVLADVGGEPMLAFMLRRLAPAGEIDSITVATSDRADDDQIARVAEVVGARVHRGSLDDVLGRVLGAVGPSTGTLVRVTADCPLIDPAELDLVVRRFRAMEDCDYASNIDPRVVPDGCDVEVTRVSALRRVASSEHDSAAREHVTLAFRRDPDNWRIAPPLTAPEPRLADLRWTVDEPSDLEFVRAVVERLGERRHIASIAEIRAAIEVAPSLADFGGYPRA